MDWASDVITLVSITLVSNIDFALENLVRLLGLETTIIVPGHRDIVKIQADKPSSAQQWDCNIIIIIIKILFQTQVYIHAQGS